MPGEKTFTVLSIAYILAIYAGSGMMREVSNTIRQIAGGRLNTMVTVGICVLLAGLLYSRRSAIKGWRFLPLVPVLCGYGLAFWYLGVPEERLHLLQYGVLTFFCSRALPDRFAGISRSLLVIALVTLAGIGDEIIQHFRPNRVGDIRDVLINCYAAMLAQALLAITTGKKESAMPVSPDGAGEVSQRKKP
jgi:hypothetical protein